MVLNTAKRFWSVFDRIVDIFFALGSVVIVYQMISVALNALSAYLINFTVTGVEAFAEWGLLLIVFITGTRILRIEKHVSMDIVTSRLSQRMRSVLIVFTSILCVVVCIVLVIAGITVTWDLWVRDIADDMKLIGFPKAIPISIIPIGSFLLLIQFMRRAYMALQDIVKTK